MQIFLSKFQNKVVALAISLVFIALSSLFGSVSKHAVNQQDMHTVSGIVTDTISGKVLPGVAIQIRGTTTGTITDKEGNYSIVVKSGDVLVFSFVGYLNKAITSKDETDINVQLAEDIIRRD